MSKKNKDNKFKDNLITRSEEARKVRKIVSIIILALIVIFVIGGISGYNYIRSALEPVDATSEEEIQVEIPLGSSSSTIASILEENEVIKNGLIFRIYIKLNNESEFQAGNYSFTQSMDVDEIINNLKQGKVSLEPLYTITIPEGLTIEQIAEIYAEKLHFTKEEFIEVVDDDDYISELMDKYSVLPEDILNEEIYTPLEGYLYPATYDFYEEEPSIPSIIERMLMETENLIYQNLDAIENKNLTIHEVATFASLVEKEASNEEQRHEIAGVFYNRLEEGMPLQTDPTVAYAVGEHLETTLYEHLEEESPYNTYQVNGLPIGPIANFSRSSLLAVLEPTDSDYFYFLHDSEGKIHYAETLEEHNQNRDDFMN
ncbi:endolytic transglycosylase MltG [Oceanobacillus bengalensis]|uniref:Endolytic murein transglycosylase n=1 Tax=Oceanobacillus bengalensis TaxID=1435466 RepID=A0A494Z5X7_9BACI|nr:endolytic transglycosylase MltG [Oceanobacillus bengalensis]RKQ17894.1 endolytic transglycosylase MltG [Oceanobacillus bengalensis]